MLGNMDSTSRALSIPHVLVRIVKHLPVRDRMNFRGVCTLWNEYCDFDPKFIFRKFDLQPLEIDALLRKTGCRRLNLEFQDCDLAYISDEMWRIWDPKLRSLRIYSCITYVETVQSIIYNCIGLEVLEIILKHSIESNLLEQFLNYSIERREQHTRLRRLSINGQFFNKMSQFLKLLTVFPCIEDFCCLTELSGGEDSYGTYDMRKLKSYTMVSENNSLWSETPVEPMLDYPWFRITTFKTSLGLCYNFDAVTEREQVFNLVTIQKDLEVIDLSIFGRYHVSDNFGLSIKSLIFHVLKTCSNLREFHLRINKTSEKIETITFTSEEFKEFVSLIFNLRSFKLPFILKKDASETTVLPLLRPNTSLSVLQLNTKEPYFLSILKLSSQLQHLNIDVYSDQQLREIIMTMPNLKILILRIHDCTNCGFIGENEESSFRRLQKLEYLHIIDCEGKITEEVFDEFCFPRLEYLGLCFKQANSLPKTLSNMPAVRTLAVYLMIQSFYWKPAVISELCKSLTNLKHLIADKLVFEDKLQIFNLLPNLRFITCYRDDETFIFDRLSRKTTFSEAFNLQFWQDRFYVECNRGLDYSEVYLQLVDSMSEDNFSD